MHAVVVHSLDEARAAVGRDTGAVLRSAPGAALFAGVGWWLALVSALRVETGWQGQAFLDCADQAGFAVEALHAGVNCLILDRDCPQFSSLAALAVEAGGALMPSL